MSELLELKAQLAQQLGEAQAKYTYFLLAVAASCVALAVQRTTGSALGWHHLPLGLAVLCWAGSFWAGCYNRLYFHSTLRANVRLLQLKDGTHPKQPLYPADMIAAMEGTMDALKDTSSSANRCRKWQFGLLIAGAALFLLWHVLQMAHAGTPAK